MFKLIDILFSPEDTGAGGKAPLTASDIENLLIDEDPADETDVIDLGTKSEEEDEEKSEEETSSEEDDEEKDDDEEDEKSLEDELEEELKEPTDEELNEALMPSRKEMLAKYPKLFKDFPELEKAYYRDRKYTELFSSVKDAEVSAEKAQTWDRFENELNQGDLSKILKAVAETDKNAFYKVADEILYNIKEIDEAAANHIYAGVIKDVIQLMVAEGNTEETKDLKTAAQLVYKFIFGNKQWEPHKPLAKEIKKDPQQDIIAKREREFLQRQFKQATTEITTRVDNTLKATVERAIDPKNSMSRYVRDKATLDTIKDVQEATRNDKAFQKVLTRLWEKAAKDDFSDASKLAIRSALINKAKQLLPAALSKRRKEALSALRVPVKETTKEKVSLKSKGSTATPNSGNKEKGKIPAGMSIKDYIMSD